MTPQGSFATPITFSCTGLPALAACTFNPATVTPNTNTVTSDLIITTAAYTVSLTPPSFGHRSRPLYAMWFILPAAVLGALGLATPNRKKLLSYILMWLLAGGCLLQAACGGGSSRSGGGGGGTGGTPAGTYSITVTATTGPIQHGTTLTLTVQ